MLIVLVGAFIAAAVPEPELVVQAAHQQRISAIAVSRDGALLATAEDYTALLKIWDLHSGLELRTVRLPADASGLAFLPDGRLVVATTKSTTELLDPASGAIVKTLQGAAWGDLGILNLTAKVAVSSKGLIAAGVPKLDPTSGLDGPGGTKIWRPDGSVVHVLRTKEDDIGSRLSAIEFSPAGDRLAQMGQGDTVELWSTKPLKRLWRAGGTSAWSKGRDIAFAPNGRTLAVAIDDDAVVLDAKTGQRVASFTHPQKVLTLDFTPSGRLVTGAADGVVRRFDLSRQAQAPLETKVGNYVNGLRRLPGTELLAVSSGRSLMLFDAAHGLIVGNLGAGTPAIAEAVPLGKHGMLIGSSDQLVYWEELSRTAGIPISGFRGWVDELATSRDGELAAVLSSDGSARTLSLYRAGETRLRWQVKVNGAENPRFSVSGDTIGLLVGRRQIHYFSTKTGEHKGATVVASELPPYAQSGPPNIVFGFALIEQSGKPVTVTAGDAGGNVCQVDAWNNAPEDPFTLMDFQEHGPVTEFAVTDDGKRFALAYPEGWLAHLIDLDSGGKPIRANARGLAFNPKGTQLAIATGAGELLIIDAVTGAEVARRPMSESIMDRVAYSADGARLIGSARDGTLRIWNTADYQLVATVFSRGPARLVLVEGGFYMGSRELLDSLAYRIGIRAFPFRQLDLQRHRPERVMATLGEGDPAAAGAYQMAYAARLKRMGYTSEPPETQTDPPEATIIRASLPLSTPQQSVPLKIMAYDKKALTRLLVRVNGVPLDGAAGRPLPAGSRWQGVVQVPLTPGANRIEISVRNAQQVESLRDRVEIRRIGSLTPTLYVVAVGVSDYNDARYRLTWAAKDAEDVAALFKLQQPRYRQYSLTLLTDKNATREKFGAVREQLMKSRPEDEVVLFMAGHGLVDADYSYWFGTWDVDFAKPSLRGIAWNDIEALLDGIPARHRLVLLDTCHAGDVDAEFPGPKMASGVQSKIFPSPRGVSQDEVEPQSGSVTRLVEDLFTDLRESGATVIAAASGAEFAYESPRWKNGAFTFVLREALEQGLADRDGNGAINATELRRYMWERVADLTGGRQRPVARRENLLADDQIVATVSGGGRLGGTAAPP